MTTAPRQWTPLRAAIFAGVWFAVVSVIVRLVMARLHWIDTGPGTLAGTPTMMAIMYVGAGGRLRTVLRAAFGVAVAALLLHLLLTWVGWYPFSSRLWFVWVWAWILLMVPAVALGAHVANTIRPLEASAPRRMERGATLSPE